MVKIHACYPTNGEWIRIRSLTESEAEELSGKPVGSFLNKGIHIFSPGLSTPLKLELWEASNELEIVTDQRKIPSGVVALYYHDFQFFLLGKIDDSHNDEEWRTLFSGWQVCRLT